MSLGLHLRELIQTYLESAIGEDKRKAARMEKKFIFQKERPVTLVKNILHNLEIYFTTIFPTVVNVPKAQKD